MKESSIAFLIPYFGRWPEWMELFIDSIERNPSVHFHFITDCDTDVSDAPNIFFHTTSFEEYVTSAQTKLGVKIQVPNAYKICDLRPFFGIIHSEIFKEYDFFGWTDVDVVFGDIRSIYTEEILTKFDVVSSQEVRLSGHCTLLRNNEKYRQMGYQVYNWQGALNDPEFKGIDEHGMTNALCMTFWDKLSEKLNMSWISSVFQWRRKSKMKSYYFVEQHSTPFTPTPWLDGSVNSQQPDSWSYFKGEITNSRDEGHKFMYLHFMNFKSSTWRSDGSKAPWEGEKSIYHVQDLNSRIVIDTTGIRNAN